MEKKLISMDEHTKHILNNRNKETAMTGVECPKCGSELFFTDDLVLNSNPPQRRIMCDSCGYKGTMFV